MLTISLHFDPDDVQDVAHAREFLDGLNTATAGEPVDHAGRHSPRSQTGLDQAAVADAAIANLWGRIGQGSRELLKASAQQEGEFSMGDLAVVLSQPTSKIVSRFANLGRSIKKMQEAIPGAESPYNFEGQQREGIWYCTVRVAYRTAILRIAKA